ncbi:MAG TPA: hypothetical protein VKU85_08465 [bacterium]|nr:hypothetical protein [bacterium]
MSMKWLRYAVAAAIVLLVVNEFMRWLSGLAGVTAAAVGGIVVAAVSVVCARAAHVGVRNLVWFLLPTAVLILIPTGVRVWRLFGEDTPLAQRLWHHLPFFLGFVAPVTILLVVWTQLHEPELDDLPPLE